MPKAPRPSKTKVARDARDPIAKPKKTKEVKQSEEPKKSQDQQEAKETKDPKASHLYTDDNPSTTIHGTGFKDHETAIHTLSLISSRSLIYQFQTVNTLYNRAKHHPSMKKPSADTNPATADMRAAMSVYRTWLDETYPAARAALRVNGGFKPLLSKKLLQRYLPRIEGSADVSEDAREFARTYTILPKGRRLGNVLVDEEKSAEADWERARYEALDGLVPGGKEKENGWKLSELWTEDREVSARHLELIAWAWSPVAEGKLP